MGDQEGGRWGEGGEEVEGELWDKEHLPPVYQTCLLKAQKYQALLKSRLLIDLNNLQGLH